MWGFASVGWAGREKGYAPIIKMVTRKPTNVAVPLQGEGEKRGGEGGAVSAKKRTNNISPITHSRTGHQC